MSEDRTDDNANDKLGWVFGIKHETLERRSVEGQVRTCRVARENITEKGGCVGGWSHRRHMLAFRRELFAYPYEDGSHHCWRAHFASIVVRRLLARTPPMETARRLAFSRDIRRRPRSLLLRKFPASDAAATFRLLVTP